MTGVQMASLLVLAVVAPVVALTRDPLRQAFVVGVYGFALTIVFWAVQAPDVALSATVVTTVALPVMVLLALRRLREPDEEGDDEGDSEESG